MVRKPPGPRTLPSGGRTAARYERCGGHDASDPPARIGAVVDADRRRQELERRAAEWASCERCALAGSRTQVVVGSGEPDADLMFVGEAPGFHEDKQGIPFVGQAGRLLETLLEEIGLSREQVYIANVLKCRPPGNRDPLPAEIESCQGYLYDQIQLIRPRVICTLGNFATKLLSGSPVGITRVRGRAQEHTFGAVTVQLFPIYHPAAALYTPAMLDMLRGDFAALPALLAGGAVAAEAASQPAPVSAASAPASEPELDDAQLTFQF
jgi:uracil-DNA glycosylase